jgi:L-seryl-tRNA(Ser) seleniumtransferase
MRALRVDKLTYAALEATLTEDAAGRADISVPIRHMLAMSVDEIRARATALVGAMNALEGWQATVIAGTSAVGGGSAPGVELPTCLVSLERRGLTADRLEARLRAAAPPVIARIESDRVVLDLRTVLPCDDEQLRALLEKL